MIIKGRLKAIVHMVPSSKCVLDVGTDHGFVPVYLVKEGITEKAIVTDISAASLNKARALIKKEGLEDKIECRLGDGFGIIQPGEADTAILAGMGGLLIRNILKDSLNVAESIKTFLLQPMSAQDLLRRWLVEHGYTIIDETLVREDGRFYEIILAVHGKQPKLKEIYYNIGYMLIKKMDPLLEEFIMYKMAKTTEIIEHLENQKTLRARKAAKRFKQRLTEYKEVYEWAIRCNR